jgi:hypothetical protein
MSPEAGPSPRSPPAANGACFRKDRFFFRRRARPRPPSASRPRVHRTSRNSGGENPGEVSEHSFVRSSSPHIAHQQTKTATPLYAGSRPPRPHFPRPKKSSRVPNHFSQRITKTRGRCPWFVGAKRSARAEAISAEPFSSNSGLPPSKKAYLVKRPLVCSTTLIGSQSLAV